ncbi:hypothetical protein SELMODRAFT_271219 [Selaginella moellendorffii]|uniref:Uncharacterized protein n=1 Tax=Selaginella moellendorffii TaxID=88036 RepID=D8S0R8_SELML|nr:signal peptide peptidase 2 [Selaginella moellendorffii]XP_002980589.1 signal peptide peptidase 2 [Selaginella moellendorffii]EFJ18240.1 hypothetical protein SELMODRAFT_153968 [Selaginella moellendorffii]EFJ21978.1 hypothetical protein SELMODRAFT_271219 [Selaginella moellendorffii]|eukprot:XP_002976868.1 signal peptide peptidase 2 [Selaginella moellendorffii]
MASLAERIASACLAVLTIAPLVVNVNPNANVILTACLTVFIGCHRSVKPAPPVETLSKGHAIRFPFVGSAVLCSLFLLFKFIPKELINGILTLYFVVLGVLALTATIWPDVKDFIPKAWDEKEISLHLPYFTNVGVEFTLAQLFVSIPGICFCAWYALRKHWLANNTLGLAFSIQGIEMLSLGSFKIGAILLAGLFVYDIFWVFFTPVMVTVAKSFDAPIKLIFPTGSSSKPFSMLGLGDIVIPGIFVALALRFDVSRGTGKRYFTSAFMGYITGIVATIIVMNVFQAAQPALLYIVPCVTGFLAVHCLAKGEIKPLLEFDEAATKRALEEATSSEETTESTKKDD